MAGIDLSGVPVVDAHTHPYRLEELLERDPDGFDTRMMFLGESLRVVLAAARRAVAVRARAHGIDGVRDRPAPLARRASRVRVEPAGRGRGAHRGPARRPGRVHEGAAGRGRRRGDPVGRGVPAAADHGAGVRGDDRREGPSRRAPRALDPRRTGTARSTTSSPASHDEATQAAADPNCVAFKSIVAYRTGLDVGDPSEAEAREAFARWRADEWRETREHAKPVRDFLIRRTLAVAKEHGRAFHFHCGGGDPDIDLDPRQAASSCSRC